jgi:hypothetical protein
MRTKYIILKCFITLGTLFSSVKIFLTISQPLEEFSFAQKSWRHDRHVVILVFSATSKVAASLLLRHGHLSEYQVTELQLSCPFLRGNDDNIDTWGIGGEASSGR